MTQHNKAPAHVMVTVVLSVSLAPLRSVMLSAKTQARGLEVADVQLMLAATPPGPAVMTGRMPENTTGADAGHCSVQV